MPKGAFYAFPNIKSFGKKSDWMEDYLLQEAGVACLAGSGFGCRGEGYLRLSYAASEEIIGKAVSRIGMALSRADV